MGATHVEKSTVQGRESKLNAVQAMAMTVNAPQACSILDPECEACQ